MKQLLYFLCVSMFIFPSLSYSQDIQATTEDGRKVILKKDGTYSIIKSPKTSLSKSQAPYQKPEKASAVFKLKGDRFLIWYDPSVWREDESSNSQKPLFLHKDGDIRAMVIAERIEASIEALRDVAIGNARQAAPDARVTYEENRVVNGKNVLCMKIEVTLQGVKFVYFSYYYAGRAGVIQQITYAPANLFSEYESDMTNFLNGLVINE